MKGTPTIDNKGKAFHWIWATVLSLPMFASAFSLDPVTGVVPRVFSPNGDGINDVVFFQLNNPQQSYVSGVVFDMTGAQVSSLAPAPDGLCWNGRAENGNLVPPGPYIYRIEGEGVVLSGVVVVVR